MLFFEYYKCYNAYPALWGITGFVLLYNFFVRFSRVVYTTFEILFENTSFYTNKKLSTHYVN
jgi:hypothetical protein